MKTIRSAVQMISSIIDGELIPFIVQIKSSFCYPVCTPANSSSMINFCCVQVSVNGIKTDYHIYRFFIFIIHKKTNDAATIIGYMYNGIMTVLYLVKRDRFAINQPIEKILIVHTYAYLR